MSRMQTNLSRHFERLLASSGVSVSYVRAGSLVAITAAPAQTAIRVDDGSGVSLKSKRRDWIVQSAALVLAGQALTPRPGDRIHATARTTTLKFEVQRLAGEECYQECDAQGEYLRIHTQLIQTETP